MDENLEARARRAVLEAGVIVDAFDAEPVALEVLASACDSFGVLRPIALQEALAALD